MIPKAIKYYVLNILVIVVIIYGIHYYGFDITNLNKENITEIIKFQVGYRDTFIFLFIYLFIHFVRYYELDWFSIQQFPSKINTMEYNKKWKDREIKSLYYGDISESFIALYYFVYYIVLQVFDFTILGFLVVYLMILVIDFINLRFVEWNSNFNILLFIIFLVLNFMSMSKLPNGYGDGGIFTDEFFTIPFFNAIIPGIGFSLFVLYVYETNRSKIDLVESFYLFGGVIAAVVWLYLIISRCWS